MKTILTVIVTAVLTSLFWFTAFNSGMVDLRRLARHGGVGDQDGDQGPEPETSRRGADRRPVGARHPGRGDQAEQLWSTRSARPAPAARASTTRSTSWRRRERRCSPPRRGRSRSCSSARAAAGSPLMSAPTMAAGSIIMPTSRIMRRASPRGSRSQRGALIGRVGSTGNANPAGPHLHFAIDAHGRGRCLARRDADQSLSAACREQDGRLKAVPALSRQ